MNTIGELIEALSKFDPQREIRFAPSADTVTVEKDANRPLDPIIILEIPAACPKCHQLFKLVDL